MRKLKLDPEALRVDTFAVGEPAARIGTVRGNIQYMEPTLGGSDAGCGSGSGPGPAPDPSGYYSCLCPTYRKTCMATCGLEYCTDLTCLTYDYCCP